MRLVPFSFNGTAARGSHKDASRDPPRPGGRCVQWLVVEQAVDLYLRSIGKSILLNISVVGERVLAFCRPRSRSLPVNQFSTDF